MIQMTLFSMAPYMNTRLSVCIGGKLAKSYKTIMAKICRPVTVLPGSDYALAPHHLITFLLGGDHLYKKFQAARRKIFNMPASKPWTGDHFTCNCLATTDSQQLLPWLQVLGITAV